MATLPVHVEEFFITKRDLASSIGYYDQFWTTDKLCILKFVNRSKTDGTAASGDERNNLPRNEIRIWGINTPDDFYVEAEADLRVRNIKIWATGALLSHPTIGSGEWLSPDQNYPLWIKKIEVLNSDRVYGFQAYYFDV